MNFSVIIPSRNPDNLRVCIASILENEPGLSPSRIIVIDDGARAGMNGEFPAVHWLAGIRPFIFSRAINAGIRHCFPDDVILLNDDTRLLMPGGFTALAKAAQGHGVVSPALTGASCNPNQFAQSGGRLRSEPQMLAFICVYIPRATIDSVGVLDQRFTAYGFDDYDYCDRVREAGLDLAVFDGCCIEHGVLPSTFRPGNRAGNIEPGRAIYNRVRAERLARGRQ